jgi:hypothetical protein
VAGNKPKARHTAQATEPVTSGDVAGLTTPAVGAAVAAPLSSSNDDELLSLFIIIAMIADERKYRGGSVERRSFGDQVEAAALAGNFAIRLRSGAQPSKPPHEVSFDHVARVGDVRAWLDAGPPLLHPAPTQKPPAFKQGSRFYELPEPFDQAEFDRRRKKWQSDALAMLTAMTDLDRDLARKMCVKVAELARKDETLFDLLNDRLHAPFPDNPKQRRPPRWRYARRVQMVTNYLLLRNGLPRPQPALSADDAFEELATFFDLETAEAAKNEYYKCLKVVEAKGWLGVDPSVRRLATRD